MFDLRAPGVTVRPIGRLDGKPAFADIFLDDVFVPDEDVIGEPGQGWRIAMSAAGNERASPSAPPAASSPPPTGWWSSGAGGAARRRSVSGWRTR